MARAAPGRASCRCGDERHAVWPFAGNRKSQTSPRRQEAGRLLPGARRAGRASRKGLGASGDRPCRVPVEVTQAERSSRNSLLSLPFTVCQSHLGRLICSGCRVGVHCFCGGSGLRPSVFSPECHGTLQGHSRNPLSARSGRAP